MTEAKLQEAVILYLKWQYPGVKYCASLGGIRTGKKQGSKAKKTGYVKGFPDLQITEARKGYFGLFLELKKDKKAYPTKEQKEWIQALNERGYKAQCTKGIDATIKALDDYLSAENTLKQD
jgi:hypothetical protein|tara:strand:+ start:3661 stop:4023 length:363 start_codon:yes stop_codon:yes gene_type:complete